MSRAAKINYELVEKTINELIYNKANGDNFPKFLQILKKTGGNSNTLREYIREYKIKYNLIKTNSPSKLKEKADYLEKLIIKSAQLSADLTNENTKLNNDKIILSNELAEYKVKCEMLSNEIATIKNNEQSEVKILRKILKEHLKNFNEMEQEQRLLELKKQAYDDV